MNLTIEYTSNGKSIRKDFPCEPKNVYKNIGMVILECDCPSNITAYYDGKIADYKIKQRKTYTENGNVYPSKHVIENGDMISLSIKDYSDQKECYLTCIHEESNNYKYYHMVPRPNGYIDVDYGRIGAAVGDAFGAKTLKEPYEPHLYWIRYYEKLSKGYVDQSKIYLTKVANTVTETVKENGETEEADGAKKELYTLLRSFAGNFVNEFLICLQITEGQVKEAKSIYRKLCERKTVNGFNTQLMKLMQISPRRTNKVSEQLATSEKDFARIVRREENLIMAMEGVQVKDDEKPVKKEEDGIEVELAEGKEREDVVSRMSKDLQPLVKNVYRIHCKKYEDRFDEYCKKHKIAVTKKLWHGSKNENWLSIIKNSLLLNPNAAITGKMFGYGIYFAPSSMKSWNYTSYHGTSWANGNSNIAFMGLYETAYGKPFHPTCADHFTQKWLDDRGYNCIHAERGTMLHQDEIVFYDESAVVLRYIVEFR